MTRWDQHEGALRAMWNEGKSSGEIADALSVNRNIVIGKLNRLGLLGHRRFEPAAWNAAVQVHPATPPRRFSWEQHA